MFNHAFIIQVHKQPELFGRTVKKLTAPNHFFFINVDKKVNEVPFKQAVAGIENVTFLEGEDRTDVRWGGFSQVLCTQRLLSKTFTPPYQLG